MKKFLLSISVLVNVSVSAQTLDEYLVMAADSNAALKVKFLEYQAALEQIPQVGALPDPEVSFGYFISPIETRLGAQEARLGAMQMFPWFGTLNAKEEVKIEMAKSKYELFIQAKDDLFYNVKKAYYTLYELEESIQITQANLEILKTFESLAVTKFETASAGMVDVLRIQLEIAELENTLLLLLDKKIPATTMFNQYLNRDADMAVVMPDTLVGLNLTYDRTEVADSVMVQNNQLESIKYMQLANEHSITVAEKMGAPSFGLGMNYIIVSERTDMAVPGNGQDALMPMITMKIPLFRGKYRAQVNEASLNLLALESMEEEVQNMLQTRLDMAWVEYDDANRRILLYNEQLEIANQVQTILIEAYSADGKEFEEILRVQRMILKYELELIKAVADKNTAVAQIESIM